MRIYYYSVSQISRIVKEKIENIFDDYIWIKGEVVRPRTSHSGHIYFNMKDDDSSITAIIWKDSKIKQPKEGKVILALGYLNFYIKQSEISFIVKDYIYVEEGAYSLRFERLKKMFFEKGYFDEGKKIEIPKFPKTIGVITSKSAAALRDVIRTLKNKYPIANIKLFYTSVQGEDTYKEIIKALNLAAEYSLTKQKLDVILLVRGGGSKEDLEVFNTPELIEFLYEFKKYNIPVVSGIGHEIDFTLTDFVVDKRASTPTMAASYISSDIEELKERLNRYEKILTLNFYNKIIVLFEKFKYYRDLFLKKTIILNRINYYTRELDFLFDKLNTSLLNKISLYETKLEKLETEIKLKSPYKILEKGFVLVKQEGKFIKKKIEFDPKKEFSLQFIDGEIVIKNY